MRSLLLCLFCLAAAASGADLTQPTLVTVKLANVPPQQVMDELARQADTGFQTLPPKMWDLNAGKPISLQVENQPFWLAMREACGKAQLSLKHATDADVSRVILTRDNQDWTQYPSVAAGPFLVNLIGLHRSSTVDMRKPADVSRAFYAKFTVFAEPRVRLLRASLYARVDEAIDDKGNAMAPRDYDDQAMNFVTSWVYNVEAKLDYPANPGAKLKNLKVSMKFIAQAKSETIEFAEPLAANVPAKLVGGRKVTLKELRRGSEEWEAVMTLGRDQLPVEQWQKALFPGNSLKLLDGAGKSIVARGFGLGNRADEATFVFKFEKDGVRGGAFGKPAKLVWEIPVQTVEIPVTVEFKDVTLP